MEGIWRSNFTAACLWLSRNSSRRAAWRTGSQTIQLLVQMLGSNPHSWFHELGQPLGTMTAAIDARARTGNGPTSVQRFDPIHHPGTILGDRQIAPPQLLKVRIPCSPWYTGLTWLVRNSSAKLRASTRSFWLPSLSSAFLRGSQTTSRLT